MTEPTRLPDPLIGRTVRGYQVQDSIGVSRWGSVYRALQISTNRTVALRVLALELAKLPGKTEHFLEESRADAALVHPHLVAVYEAGQADGIYFCAMEYMDGPPLRQFLRQGGGVDEQRLLSAIVGVARALDFLWQHQVQHQPPMDKNVLTNLDGAVKLINVPPIEVPASQSPREDVLSLGVMIATLANDIAPVSKSISEFVEDMLGTDGQQKFASPGEVAEVADALGHKLFPPVRFVRSNTGAVESKRLDPAIAVVVGLFALAVIAAAWCWWRTHIAH